MRIAVIGAGNVGRALSTSFKRAGHEVALSDHDPESAAEMAAENGVQAAREAAAAVRSAETVGLAVPFSA